MTTAEEMLEDFFDDPSQSFPSESIFYDPHLDINGLRDGMTILHRVLRKSPNERRGALVDLLQHPDIDLNRKDSRGMSPIFHLDCVQYLPKVQESLQLLLEDDRVSIGDDVRLPHGVTYLHFITADNNTAAIEMVIAMGRADHLPDGDKIDFHVEPGATEEVYIDTARQKSLEVKMLPDSLHKLIYIAGRLDKVTSLWKTFLEDRTKVKDRLRHKFSLEGKTSPPLPLSRRYSSKGTLWVDAGVAP